MTTYTAVTGSSASYTQTTPDNAVWDLGVSEWDFNGNIFASVWDTSARVYSESPTTTQVWSKQ